MFKVHPLVLICCYLLQIARAQLLALQSSAFTPDECHDIAELFAEMEVEQDERTNPLLPLMEGDFGVTRTNRYNDGSLSKSIEAILTRLLSSQALKEQFSSLPPGSSDSATELARNIDFTLLHEFTPGGHFDWHVDSKPGDKTGRTINVNVMLSNASEFEGGKLQVGEQVYSPQIGDAYAYYAATPHRVSPLTSGRRHTLVIALTERLRSGDFDEEEYAVRRKAHWDKIETGYNRLTGEGGGLAGEPKVHILHGEHLEALNRGDEAQQAFCRSYRSHDKASGVAAETSVEASVAADGKAAHAAPSHKFAAEFFASGVGALNNEGGPDLKMAENYLAMAACVHPEHPEASQALAVVRDALRIRAEQQQQQQQAA